MRQPNLKEKRLNSIIIIQECNESTVSICDTKITSTTCAGGFGP